MVDLAVHAVEMEVAGGLVVLTVNGDGQGTALETEELMVFLLAPATGVDVACRAAGEPKDAVPG